MTYQNDELTRIAAQRQAECGMTDDEMAYALGIDPTRYKNFSTANGDEWSFREACVLADAVGFSLDKVAGRDAIRESHMVNDFDDALSRIKGYVAMLEMLSMVEHAGEHEYQTEMYMSISDGLRSAVAFLERDEISSQLI